MDPNECNPCAPFWLRQLIYWPNPEGGDCLLALEDGSFFNLEDLSGKIKLEAC